MEDSEKVAHTSDYSPNGSGELPEYGTQQEHKRSWGTRIIDSFKKDPNAHATPPGTVGADGKVYDIESATAATANTGLHRSLKGRHLQMIAIGE